MDLYSSSRVTTGLLVASLINALLVSFGGWPSRGRFAVVSYSFRFLMIDFMVLCEIFKAQGIFYNLTLLCTFLQLYP